MEPTNKPLDPFRCDGPGCTRSLRDTSPDAWIRLTPTDAQRSYVFCSTACALAFDKQRKNEAKMAHKRDPRSHREYMACIEALNRLPTPELERRARSDVDARNVLVVRHDWEDIAANAKRARGGSPKSAREVQETIDAIDRTLRALTHPDPVTLAERALAELRTIAQQA